MLAKIFVRDMITPSIKSIKFTLRVNIVRREQIAYSSNNLAMFIQISVSETSD